MLNMTDHQTLILLYILFIWIVILHTLEEIAQGMYTIELGPFKPTRIKYLLAASGITTVNLGTLALIVAGHRYGLYLGLFTTSVIGILQLPAHAIGFMIQGRKPIRFGAGFYSSIPLAIIGLVLFLKILGSL